LDGKKYHKTNEEIERQIEKDREEIEQLEKNKGDLSQMYKAWLTDWRVPHNTENIETVMKWLCMAFTPRIKRPL
jgi:hypothetical protein